MPNTPDTPRSASESEAVDDATSVEDRPQASARNADVPQACPNGWVNAVLEVVAPLNTALDASRAEKLAAAEAAFAPLTDLLGGEFVASVSWQDVDGAGNWRSGHE